MDHLDFAVYRFLSADGEARFWAGRRIVDPDIPAREIAERVGVSENGVRARLRGLSEKGYLRGREVTPNPSMFGVRVHVAEIPVQSPSDAERVFRDLALVEGVVFARDTLDEGKRHVGVYFVSDRESTTARRVGLLRRLAPTGEVLTVEPYWIPACERENTPLDWRLLQAITRWPEATPAETARSVGVSLKTTARRLRQLVASRAVWSTHGSNSEEFPLALIRLELRDPSDRAAVEAAVWEGAGAWMPVAHDGLGLEPEEAVREVAGLVPADSPTAVERVVQKLSGVPGVSGVHRTFALGSRSYPAWFRDRIADHVPSRT